PRSSPVGERAGSIDGPAAGPLNGGAAPGSDDSGAPRSEEEHAVARLWGEVLRVDRVGGRDAFFRVGGHSLLALRRVSKIHAAFGVEISLGQFFATPTVEHVAAEIVRLQRRRGVAASIVPVRRDGILPLSNAQERLWFVERMLRADGPRPYNVSIAI